MAKNVVTTQQILFAILAVQIFFPDDGLKIPAV
jgi:hypothetical protein